MKKKAASILILLGFVASCGYRGALYIPEEPPATTPQEQKSPQPSEEDS